MGFLFHTTDDNRVPGIEYLPCGAITPQAGMLLVMTGGNLAVCSGASAPSYVSMCQRESACTAGELIPVIRVQKDMIFQAPADGESSLSSLKSGDKVTIGEQGLTLTTTTTGGVAEIVEVVDEGKAARVRF